MKASFEQMMNLLFFKFLMISKQIKQEIEKLFSKKKYEEVIKISDSFILQKDRPPGLACLLGTCKFLLKEKKKEDLISALLYFQEAYQKDSNGINGLSGITNYINTSVYSAKRYPEMNNYLNKAEKYYEETKLKFENNINFVLAAKKLFSYQLDKLKQSEIAGKIISRSDSPLFEKIDSIFFQNYVFGWSQEKYTEQTKINTKNLPNYKVKDIKDIKFEKKSKIHLGLVSGDFTDQHSIFYFLRDTLKYIDRNKFKVYLFSFNRNQNNQILGQEEIKKLADEFVNLEEFDNQQCIEIIQGQKIEILIDVMGLTFFKRISLFNARVSPIQISWLATCNTNGITNIDYMIADHHVITKEEEKFYPEKIVKLPDIWNVHCGYDLERKPYQFPCEKNDFFTFGSLNNFHKISNEVLEAWCKILQKCKNSKLILKSSSFDCNIEQLNNKFHKFGVGDKVNFLDVRRYPHKKDHMNVYKSIDLALDTFPYNGVTTTFEALWMGVPVLILKGFNFNSKCGFSIIKNSNYTNLISYDIDEYIERAIYFYENREEFVRFKKDLFNNILNSPLFDTKKFSQNFGSLLLNLKKNYK